MTVLRYEIPISVTLVSPFATRGLVVDRASIDLPLARDQEGCFILPGTLITGVLRAALEHLASLAAGTGSLPGQARPLAADIGDLFGRASTQDEGETPEAHQVSNTPRRGQLFIRDLSIDKSAKVLERRQDYPRIQVDKDVGSVSEGFLQFIEMPFAIGDKVTFSGTGDLRAGVVSADRAVALLRKALALVPALGAIKSSGFGRLADENGFAVGAARAVSPASSTRVVALKQPVEVSYIVDRPFLVGGRMASANLFKGSMVIPGAAIKGALATALQDAELMTEAMGDLLAAITIDHAFPQPFDEQGNPKAEPWRPLPLSLATADVGQGRNRRTRLYDRLLADPDAALPKDGERTLLLSFAPDFKGDSQIREHLGLSWPLDDDPGYDVRTRTKIDRKTGAAEVDEKSEAGQLFSYAAVKSKDHVWVGRIVLPEGADPTLVGQIVALLETGIVGLGKTSAMLSAVFGQPTAATATPAPPYALTLMTPAVLNDLEALNARRSLFDDYGAYWRALGYRLIRFFAAQELEGGYVALRYPPRPGWCSSYLLTQPGSVFLVEPEEGATPIEELLTFGLPPNLWLGTPKWKTTPFLRENGFGEVRLNVVDHAELRHGRNLAARQEHAA